jgi:hypothetical protein
LRQAVTDYSRGAEHGPRLCLATLATKLVGGRANAEFLWVDEASVGPCSELVPVPEDAGVP